MQVKIPVLTAIIVLTTVLAIPLATRTVHAIPGNSVDSPANIWYPYGGLVHNLQFNFYSTETVEFTNFELGHVDVTDWELPTSKFASYDANPDFVLTPTQGQFGMFGVYYNGAASTWANWGCDWDTGTPFTSTRQTYVTACGIQVRQALAHLFDRPRFITDSVIQGAAQALADDSPPAKDPSGSPLATQCLWDTLHPSCISAYNIAPDPGGFAAPGSPDFCAAADHVIAAGIASGKTAGSCVLTGTNAGVFAHHLRFMIRNNDPKRLAMGNGLMNAINQLFGGTVVDPTYGNIRTIGFPIVFSDPPTGPIDDWDAYTFGYGLPGPFPDHLQDLYGSLFASDYCGSPLGQNDFPDNPTFVCRPDVDADTLVAATTTDIAVFKSATLAAMNDMGKAAVDLPAYSIGIRIAALRSVAGLNNQRGTSYTNFWSMLYGHQDPAYTPANSLYAFGGGDPTTLRWGQASGTTELNVFNVQTVWEFNVIGEVYDTLFASSPIQPANVFCWMCNTFTQSVDLSGNQHFLVELRQNLRWHDGVPIDAKDVKFSFLNLRDHAKNLGGGLRSQSLRSITILSPTTLDIVFTGASISNPIVMQSIVFPRHLWELPGDTTYGDVGKVDDRTLLRSDGTVLRPPLNSVGYDPITSGTFIGSAPFVCRSVFSADLGKVGTGCVKNADGSRGGQAIGASGTMLLQAFDFTGASGNTDPFNQYMRSTNPAWGSGSGTAAQSGQFQEFSWADRYDNATVTIRDLASVAACFSKTSAGCADGLYWLRSAFHPSTPTIISSEVAIVASHLDDTWISPFSWNGIQSQQPGQTLPNIVPFTP